MTFQPVTVRPRVPALSRAGRWLAIAAGPWLFGLLFGASALGLVGRDDPPGQRWLVVVLAILPVVLFVFHKWLGRIPGLRWLHHATQPRLVVAPDGLHVRLPETGERVLGWDEVIGLRSRPMGGADVLGRDGVVLARLPESLDLAAGTRWRGESVASVVVQAMPDRYRLSRATWAGVPNEFTVGRSESPTGAPDPWARRRRLVNVGIGLAFVAVTAFLVTRWLMP